jgi:DDB1- and CUL4-associated factor 8
LRPHKRRAKLWHFDLPDLLILLASGRWQQAAEEDSSEDLDDNAILFNLILRAADGGVSSADDGESS